MTSGIILSKQSLDIDFFEYFFFYICTTIISSRIYKVLIGDCYFQKFLTKNLILTFLYNLVTTQLKFKNFKIVLFLEKLLCAFSFGYVCILCRCFCIHISACTCVCVSLGVCVCMSVRISARVSMHIFVCEPVCVSINIYMSLCMYTNAFILLVTRLRFHDNICFYLVSSRNCLGVT